MPDKQAVIHTTNEILRCVARETSSFVLTCVADRGAHMLSCDFVWVIVRANQFHCFTHEIYCKSSCVPLGSIRIFACEICFEVGELKPELHFLERIWFREMKSISNYL